MKFMHLSDLHIGKSVNGFSMIAEQKHILRQIIGHIKTEKPAAVVIAGDVYDRAIPSVEAVRVFDDFLTGLADTKVAVLLISGNHDSPERLNYASRLLLDKQIYFAGSFDGRMQKVTLADEHGDVNFWLLPFVKPVTARGFFAEQEIEGYDDLVAAALNEAKIDYAARNVLVSHQFYTRTGVTAIRSESELNPVGGLDAVNAELLGGFDYAALGHLHGSQGAGPGHVRYCGSPLKYSFSECRHEKSLTLVALHEKGNLQISALALHPIHDMREMKGNLKKLLSDEISGLADPNDYLRVVLTDAEELIDPIGQLRAVYPNIMSLDFENARIGIDISDISADIEAIEKLSSYELFKEFFLEMQGEALSTEQSEIILGLLERLGEE
jgi:exonuclease SbcD